LKYAEATCVLGRTSLLQKLMGPSSPRKPHVIVHSVGVSMTWYPANWHDL
jgi:hypothetical protein